MPSYDVNWNKFDINNDGQVSIPDAQACAPLGLPQSLAMAINRYILVQSGNSAGLPVIPQYDINGDLIPDETVIQDYGTLIYQGPWDLNANGSVTVADWANANQDGWPFEPMMEIYQYIAGGALPPETYNLMKESWLTTIPANGGDNQNLAWFPLPHNPNLPISSLPEPPPSPPPPPPPADGETTNQPPPPPPEVDPPAEPGTNPAPEPPPIDWDDYHPLDFNHDGVVSFPDLLAANGTYGQVVGMMVYRYLMGGNPYDINEDGIVDIHDLLTAQTQGVPEHILYHMQAQVMNPPPPVIDYEPEPEQEAPTEDDGSAYHPLDINQDGEVSIMDLVAVASNDNYSQVAKAMMTSMIQKYMDGINPYDVNGDGIVNILDVNEATQNGLPETIINDMVANIGSSAPLPPVTLPEPPPIVPGPVQVEENLYIEPGNYILTNGTPYYGPVHRIYNNMGELYMTEKIHKSHSRVLIPVTPSPEPAVIETPPGQPNLPPSPPVNSQNAGSNLLGNYSADVINQLGELGATVGDLNGDGIIDILDLIQQQNQGSSGNQVGGGPSNNNQQQNNNSGGGGGGAY